jgi:osmoprotectant transport system permease protein
MKIFFLSLLTCLFSNFSIAENKPTIVVGSKIFTESYILGEILAQTIEDAGELTVRRRLGLGATGIIFESLKSGEIDIYPEYTGTISEVILKDNSLKTIAQINEGLSSSQLSLTESLGFNDNYALAMEQTKAEELGISTISDLKKYPDLRAGFTHEFIKRQDGYEALLKFYNMSFKNMKGMEHSLAYESLASKKLDLIEIYSTDAKIARYKLKVLKDDLHFFPKYLAVFIFRPEKVKKYPKTWAAIQKLQGSIDENKMIELNAKVELESWSFEKTASSFLNKSEVLKSTAIATFLKRTQEHLSLVFFSLLLAVIAGLPLGILAARSKALAQTVLLVSGVMQTIPSLALLCFLIPVFGIGYVPAVVALFLYALLPIVRNTYVGLSTIDSKLLESAQTLGLTSMERLRLIDLPLASPTILSGIKLSAVINVGTATLAAFIGAGGYGAIIVTGLALNNNQIILQGAIPSALLAILVHLGFEVLDKKLIPKGLRN